MAEKENPDAENQDPEPKEKKARARKKAFSITSLMDKIVELRVNAMNANVDSVIVGKLVGLDEFFIYIQDGQETVCYNASNMVCIKEKPAPRPSKEDPGRIKEDEVINESQADIEEQKRKNRDRRLKRQREKIASSEFA